MALTVLYVPHSLESGAPADADPPTPDSGFRVSGTDFGFGVSDFGFRFRIWVRVSGFGYGFRVSDFGFRVRGSGTSFGFRVRG